MIGATYLVKGYVNARRWNMKLKSITLQNFRGIEKLTIVYRNWQKKIYRIGL